MAAVVRVTQQLPLRVVLAVRGVTFRALVRVSSLVMAVLRTLLEARESLEPKLYSGLVLAQEAGERAPVLIPLLAVPLEHPSLASLEMVEQVARLVTQATVTRQVPVEGTVEHTEAAAGEAGPQASERPRLRGL